MIVSAYFGEIATAPRRLIRSGLLLLERHLCPSISAGGLYSARKQTEEQALSSRVAMSTAVREI